jgi:hypothetical protein
MAQQEAKVILSAEDRFSRSFDAFKRQLREGNSAISGFDSHVGKLGLSLGALGAGLSVGAGLTFLKSIANDLDALNDASDALGDTIENISGLEDVARRNGGSLDTVTTAVLKMNQALNSAKEDSAASRALRAIGLDAAELRRQSPTEALQSIARALAGYEKDGNRARIIQELFGKSTRELAAFLNDVAEAGKVNATVTEEQSKAAEKFNKEMAALSTNVSNAGRSIVGDLLPAINKLFEKPPAGTTIWDVLTGKVSREFAFGSDIEREAKALERTKQVLKERIAAEQKLIDIGTDAGGVAARRKSAFEQQLAAIEKQAEASAAAVRAVVAPFRASQNYGDAAVKKAEDITNGGQDKKITEAERYITALRNTAVAAQDLNNVERLMVDVRDGIFKGTDAEFQRAYAYARQADEVKRLNTELEREVGFEKLLSDKRQRDINSALSMLENTPSGQRDRDQAQADILTEFMRDPANQTEANLRKFNEAMEEFKRRAKGTTDEVKSEFDKLADAIDKSMDRATDAILDFVVEGKGSVGDLFKAFGRDLLRREIEGPIRDVMKHVSAHIKNAITDVGTGKSPLSGILDAIFGSQSGGGGGWANAIASMFGGARANGGPVRKGRAYWVGEHGPEPFIPHQDGTIVSNGAAGGAGAGTQYVDNRQITITGSVPAEQVRMFRNMLAAALLRSMRLGGAAAG